MKLSFNKQPVLDTSQLDLFGKNKFQKGDPVWWDGYYPVYTGDNKIEIISKKQSYYGSVIDPESAFFDNKQTVFVNVLFNTMFIFPENLRLAKLEPVPDKYAITEGSILFYKANNPDDNNILEVKNKTYSDSSAYISINVGYSSVLFIDYKNISNKLFNFVGHY